MRCFKQKVFCGGNTEKWGLGWWSALVKVDANYKKGSALGEEEESPPSMLEQF